MFRVCLVVGLQPSREIVLSARHHRTFRSGEVTFRGTRSRGKSLLPESSSVFLTRNPGKYLLDSPYPRIPVLHSLYKISVVFST